VGGVPELIAHGVDGFLEAVGDIPAMAARVTSLLTDPDLHYRMSKAGRWTASARFCSEKIIPQYESHYKEVIERGR
jgi:glycosyltransferase involved in cell wall biosynthesis